MHIIIHTTDKTINIIAKENQSLAKAIWLSGKVNPPPLCSGLGRCGQCRVKFISQAPSAKALELSLLNEVELKENIRLACKHNMADLVLNEAGCIEISLVENSYKQLEVSKNNTDFVKLAIDLGTTSLHFEAIDKEGNSIAKGEQINPQMGAGSDIVSRLAFAMQEHGRAKLANLVIKSIQDITQKLPPVHEICIAANTAMSGIFLQKDIKSLAVAPYSLPFDGDNIEHIEGLAPIYIPPQLAPFIGGDISAGYAALIQNENIEYPFIFTDLGTNAEFILASDASTATLASVPLGPALEGIGLSLGQMAHATAKGIVCAVNLSPKGLLPTTIDAGQPSRICGTGYLSLIHCLLRLGIVQADGRFCLQDTNPLAAQVQRLIEKKDNEYILRLWPEIAENMYISASDIEEILKVKAAFSLALQELLNATNLKQTNIKNIYIAGALGSHVNANDLEGLGFIPYGMSSRLVRVGNTALKGAKLLLTNTQKRKELKEWSAKNTLIQLAEKDDFIHKYSQHMQFNFIG